jgi:hypothetical protein
MASTVIAVTTVIKSVLNIVDVLLKLFEAGK